MAAMKYLSHNITDNLNFKNQTRVVKFELMDAIDTKIKKIIKKNF